MTDCEPEKFEEYLIAKGRFASTIKNYISVVKIYFSEFNEVTKENMIEFRRNQSECFEPSTVVTRCKIMDQYCDFIGKSECRLNDTAKAAIFRVYVDATDEFVCEGTVRQLAEQFCLTESAIRQDYYDGRKMLGEYRIEKADCYEVIQWGVLGRMWWHYGQ